VNQETDKIVIFKKTYQEMDIRSEKLLLIERIARVQDKRILAQFKDILQGETNPIVGYQANGVPITKQDFITRIETAEKDYEAGKYLDVETLEKESLSW